MMRRRRVDLEKFRSWRERVRRQRESGLSIRAFCAAESLSEPSFYWWRRELAGRKALTRVRPSTQRSSTAQAVASFVPVTVASSSPCAAIEIALPSGVIVRVWQDGSAPLLREVLAALEVK